MAAARTETVKRVARGTAILALFLGLADGAYLLGVSLGPISPISVIGPQAFTFLSVFAVTRVFAAVGLWIAASWGAVVLFAATVTELGFYLSGRVPVDPNPLGIGFRLLLVMGTVWLFALQWSRRRARVQD